MRYQAFQEETGRTESFLVPLKSGEVPARMLHCALGLSSELGEMVQNPAFWQDAAYSEDHETNAKEELGDVAWYLALGFRALDVPMCGFLHPSTIEPREGRPFENLVRFAGDVSDWAKRAAFYGKAPPWETACRALEAATYEWELLCKTLRFDHAEVLEANVRKLRARYPEKWTSEACESRDLAAEAAAVEGA